MRPENLMLRCYAEYADNQWQAFCIDLCLAAQADTFEETESKLKSMVCEYVYDPLEGEDREYAGQSLARKSPLFYRLKYRFYVALSKVGVFKSEFRELFTVPLPLVPSPKVSTSDGPEIPALTCKEVKTILKEPEFTPRPHKGASHEQRVKDIEGERYKVTVAH